MKRSIRQLCLVTLAGFVLVSCTARETEIHTSTTGARAEGSGVRDASGLDGGAASGAGIGVPGR